MKNRSKLTMASAMFIFGTIGIFRRFIPLSSGVVSLARGFIGTVILLLATFLMGKRLSGEAIKKNLFKLIISGALIGFNWIFLFEAYNYTTVATATLCYYMAPVFVMIFSPVILHTKTTLKRVASVIVALVGMVLVSGVFSGGVQGTDNLRGIIFGLIAAFMYGCVVIINKLIKDIGAYDKTIMQLGTATVVLIPYLLITEDLSSIMLTTTTVILLIAVGIIHTGVAYGLYFGSMDGMSANSIALFSYIDPVVAIILSCIILKEPMGILEVIGAILILGATLYSEIASKE